MSPSPPDGPAGVSDGPAGPTVPDGPAPPLSFSFAVTTLHVAGAITANGIVPESTCAGDELRGQVFFYEEDGPASFALPISCAGAAFAFEGDIVAGSYRVAVLGAASSLPPMTVTVASALELRGDRSDLAFDLGSRHVAGTITQNGAAPPCAAAGEAAQVLFENLDAGALFSLGVACPPPGIPFAFSGTVAPGTYKVRLLGEVSSLPSSSHVLAEGVVVQSDVTDLAYDVKTHPVSGTVTLNGAVPGQPERCRGSRGHVSFESKTDGALTFQVPCADAGTPFTFSGESYEGSFTVSVAGQGSDLPREPFRPATTVEVMAPVADLTVDVPTRLFSGTVTVNGAAPDACGGDLWGQINAYDAAQGTNFNIDVPCTPPPFAFAADLYPGTYSLTASVNGGPTLFLDPAFAVDGTASDFDAKTADVIASGSVAMNGAPVCGSVELAATAGDASATIDLPCDGHFAASVPPGRYRVTVFPTGFPPFMATATLDAPGADFHLDLATRKVSGTITVDGATPDCATPGRVQLGGFLFSTRCGSFEGEVYVGSYDVVFFGSFHGDDDTGVLAGKLTVS